MICGGSAVGFSSQLLPGAHWVQTHGIWHRTKKGKRIEKERGAEEKGMEREKRDGGEGRGIKRGGDIKRKMVED